MAKQIYLQLKIVTFFMHDGTEYNVMDKVDTRGNIQPGGEPTGGIQLVNDGTNALKSFENKEVIEVPLDGGGIAYLNPHDVIDVNVQTYKMGRETPWADDFCQPVDGCDCGEDGGVEYIEFAIDGEPARVTPQLPDTTLSYCGSYPTTMMIDFRASEGYELGYVNGDVVIPNPTRVPVDGGGVYKFITQKIGDASTQVRYSVNITCQN